MANALVTLALTMMGQFSLRNFKISMVLLVVTLGLAAAWSYLPRVWFIVVVVTAVGTVLMGLAGRNGRRQTRLAGPPPQPRFANARSVRNELERARLRHPHRLAADPAASRSRDDLMRLEPLDILTSPVFSLSAIDE